MNILNIFKRHACISSPSQTTFERMEYRHSVRPNFAVPQTYAELMQLHREIGQRCAIKAQDTEELLWRAEHLQILQRQAMAMQYELAPPVRRIIERNIKTWQQTLRVAPAPRRRPRIIQLCFDLFA